MFSWTDDILKEAKLHVKSMVCEVAGCDDDNNNICGSTDECINNNGQNGQNKTQKTPLYAPFQLPITYLAKCDLQPLSPIVVQDLELVETKGAKSMYDHLFKPSHPFASAMVHEWKKQFTNNTQYLEDTQQIIQETNSTNYFEINHGSLMEIWKDTKEDAYFLEKYCYIEWDILTSLNRSASFMQVLSVVNMLSPAISLVIPILFLVFPFILLKIKGVPITFTTYIDVLKEIAKHHFIGKTIVNLSSISFDKLIYLVLAAGMYFYQIYQNILLCQRFYKNLQKINSQLCEIRNYIAQTVANMDMFCISHQTKPSYRTFCSIVQSHCDILREFNIMLEPIQPMQNLLSKISQIGYMLKCYYELHSNAMYETSIRYSFGFEGFLDNLRGVNANWRIGNISLAKFGKDKSCEFKEQYYPPHLLEPEHIKNTCILDRKIIITGPNASGKTTLLKTTTINVVFTQQLGCGFYGEESTLNPYTHIHSYLNIPDTSERDSLFQAESRRCKEIIDVILQNPVENGFRHYCIFDELYSGTNPLEATKSAYAFLKYLTKFNHVDFILTTHYVSICTKLKKCKQIRNYKMDVIVQDNGSIKYTYKMKRGISKIQGAVRILEDMNYPAEIIESVRGKKTLCRKT